MRNQQEGSRSRSTFSSDSRAGGRGPAPSRESQSWTGQAVSSINRFRSFLYWLARLLGDVNAA
jgi:hypothetical protein